MTDIVERALALWGHPLPADDAALEAFRGVYHDPVLVNGASTPVGTLVDRARMLQEALTDLHHEVHEVVVAPGRRAVAFTITGRHAAALTTPLGAVAASGADVSVQGIDIFLLDDEEQRIVALWAVADWLALLMQTGAVEQIPTVGHG